MVRAWAALTLLAVAAAPLAARSQSAPPPLPSLRHLVFAVKLTVDDQYERRLEATVHADPVMSGRTVLGSSTGPASGQMARSRVRSAADSKVVCDVVAVTADGGLVVDVREEGRERSAPPVRVGIESNGRLTYPPTSRLELEEVAILQLLGRRVVGSEDHPPGTTWTIEDGGGQNRSKMSFKAAGKSADDALLLDLDQEFREGGARLYSGGMQGRIDYDSARLVPRKAALTAKRRIETSDSYRTLDLGIDLNLVEDSFSKR